MLTAKLETASDSNPVTQVAEDLLDDSNERACVPVTCAMFWEGVSRFEAGFGPFLTAVNCV